MDLKKIGEGFVGAASMAGTLLTPMLRSRRIQWGATEEETQRTLPGDEWVPDPKWSWTHAITTNAPPYQVWPWLVQIGQRRGGFYSYEALENLVGCKIHNVVRIVPELQHLKVGDEIYLAPQMPGFPVVQIEPNQTLVLHAYLNTKTWEAADRAAPPPEAYAHLLWMWYLEERSDGTTRLFSRSRYDYTPSRLNRLAYGPTLIEPIGHVMDIKMLRSIKALVERNISGYTGDTA